MDVWVRMLPLPGLLMRTAGGVLSPLVEGRDAGFAAGGAAAVRVDVAPGAAWTTAKLSKFRVPASPLPRATPAWPPDLIVESLRTIVHVALLCQNPALFKYCRVSARYTWARSVEPAALIDTVTH